MKRFCKKVDISDPAFVRSAVLECLRKRSKRMRPDTVRLFSSVGGVSRTQARRLLSDMDGRYYSIVDSITGIMVSELESGDLTLPPIRMRDKSDGKGGKVRRIAVQEIRQLLYDHVAVMAMWELNRLMGEHQVSGRKGMGQSMGARLVSKWVRGFNGRRFYFAKMDIRKYYNSVDVSRLVSWLGRRVKNARLLWLVDKLLRTGEPGLNIGSYLSHFLANLYLSDVWHYAKQRLDGIRQALFYMDDLLLLGTNRRKLLRDAREVEFLLEAKGLKVKDGWQVHECSVHRPIDVVGVRFSRRLETVRKRIFRKARRALLRVNRAIKGRRRFTRTMACRLSSYHGWLVKASCTGFMRRTGEAAAMRESSLIIKTI